MNKVKNRVMKILCGFIILNNAISAISFANATEIVDNSQSKDSMSINTQDLAFSIEDNKIIVSSKARTNETQETISELYKLIDKNPDLEPKIIDILNNENELVGIASKTIQVIKYVDELGQEVSQPLSDLEKMSPTEMIKTPRGVVDRKISRGNLDYSMIVFTNQYAGIKYIGTEIDIHWRGDTVFNLSDAVGEGKDSVVVEWPGAFYMYSNPSESYPSAFCDPTNDPRNSSIQFLFREKSGKTTFVMYGDDQGTAGKLGRVSSVYTHTYLGLNFGPNVSLPGGFSLGLGAGIAHWNESLNIEFNYN